MITNNDGKNEAKIIVRVDAEIEDLVPGFLQNRQNDIKKILEALDVGDYETIRVLGHSMKGSGGGYGFDAITDIGLSLEQAAKAKNSEEVRKWAEELSNYLENVEVAYE
ncbi:MAG: Hpt domain-containing protein [Desulfobacteraceae bacterium]|nr:Hpt domain-containing protein [Pseudomonadota bacterium]MCG2831330.1 Hpt domain-containing protein [Desulfobacteraceae bacterium]